MRYLLLVTAIGLTLTGCQRAAMVTVAAPSMSVVGSTTGGGTTGSNVQISGDANFFVGPNSSQLLSPEEAEKKFPDPMARPCQSWETAVQGSKFVAHKVSYELEGVCEFDVSNATCWTLDGKANDKLSDEMTSAIKQEVGGIPKPKEAKMKTRLLVMRSTFPSTANWREPNVVMSGGPLFSLYGEPRQGWHKMTSLVLPMVENADRHVICGFFRADTTEFPFRYESVYRNQQSPKATVPIKNQKLKVDGVTFEVTLKDDQLKVQAVNEVNTTMSMEIFPLDAKGKPTTFGDPGQPGAGSTRSLKLHSPTPVSAMSFGFKYDPDLFKKLLIVSSKSQIFTFDGVKLDKD